MEPPAGVTTTGIQVPGAATTEFPHAGSVSPPWRLKETTGLSPELQHLGVATMTPGESPAGTGVPGVAKQPPQDPTTPSALSPGTSGLLQPTSRGFQRQLALTEPSRSPGPPALYMLPHRPSRPGVGSTTVSGETGMAALRDIKGVVNDSKEGARSQWTKRAQLVMVACPRTKAVGIRPR